MFLHISDLVLWHSTLCEGEKEKVIRKSTDDYQWAQLGVWRKQPKPGKPTSQKQQMRVWKPRLCFNLSLITCVYVGLSRGFSKKLFTQLEGSIKIKRPFAACTRSVLTCAYVREFQWLESCSGESHGQRSMLWYSSYGHKENWTKLKWLSTHTHSTEFC